MHPSIYLFDYVTSKVSSDDRDAWKRNFERRLDGIGIEYERIANRLRLWNPTTARTKTSRQDVSYQDGIEVFKVSMPREYPYLVVGFNFCRLYFLDGESHPAYQSAKELFAKSGSPPVLRQIPLLQRLDAFIEQFNGDGAALKPVEGITWTNLASKVAVETESRSSEVASLSASQYSSAILGMVRNQRAMAPSSFQLTLIDQFASDKKKAIQVASSTSQVLEREWGCQLRKAKVSSPNEFEQWLSEEAGAQKVSFMALDGKKGERPAKEALAWMRQMEESQVPYVLFSSAHDVNPTYTRHGNAMHVLAKAGGEHYQTRATSFPDFHDHMFIGLDLGVGSQYRGKCVVVTVTDAKGVLKGFWRAIKDSDETLTPEILHEAVTWAVQLSEALRPECKLVAIRDGRCPHHERVEVYRKLLPEGRSMLVEYTKKGNPLIVSGGMQPSPGMLAVPPNSNEGFLFTARAAQKGMLTNTTRFRPLINDFGYSLEMIGEFLVALCFAPKLSFQPSSIPAPIYWADGIASISNTNLQFAGWRHLPNVTRDFRTN